MLIALGSYNERHYRSYTRYSILRNKKKLFWIKRVYPPTEGPRQTECIRSATHRSDRGPRKGFTRIRRQQRLRIIHHFNQACLYRTIQGGANSRAEEGSDHQGNSLHDVSSTTTHLTIVKKNKIMRGRERGRGREREGERERERERETH